MNSLALPENLETIVYHELRAPLGLMAAAARSASDDCEDEWVRAQCEVIGRTAERMLRIVASVIESARHSDFDSAAMYSPLDILVRMLGDVEAVGIRVEREVAEDSHQHAAHGSQSKFETLLHSLLMSTVDHGRPGCPVTVRYRVRGGNFELEIENFKRNVQAHYGLGLGARYCAILAEQLSLELLTGDIDDERYRVLLSGRIGLEREISLST